MVSFEWYYGITRL